ncbi:hypothetical protein HNQ10_002637 [Deinococcus metallilatus]|uniref:Uncharacterized protein n=1 Tax=Deinococcus metallilatus TaxID=1211322 RepID=A0ABR6MV35_9DEIO|nr:hypothetical protein [Deinococcus metallilatus]
MRLYTTQPLAALACLNSGSPYQLRRDLCERDGEYGSRIMCRFVVPLLA